ncbi:nuclear autoantigenic sperm protein isoform X1 [Chiloscyllium plagiosum]|uniref:nuclear autoantigenic sperm protein isoform X1 n=1 Tax=Chiloscyllium plagiosum TaxID=36176 RepID=UPI001CB8388E|nr:nuclear autoantigenic sperm protein isoform X1 [Chiloscyllium plagiosum]
MADQEPSASTSSVAGSAEGADVSAEATKLLGTGKRHMVMEDFVAAVNTFQDACRLLSERHGEMADECGEAYFCYGKALLELARMERGVLGNALQGVPEDDDEETTADEDSKVENAENVDEKEREELREQVYAALAEEKDKPADDEAPAANVSADQDVAHKETESHTETPDEEKASTAGVLCTTKNEALLEIESSIVQDDVLNEQVAKTAGCSPGNCDHAQEGKVKDQESIPEDVKDHLQVKNRSSEEVAANDSPMMDNAGVKVPAGETVKVVEVKLEHNIALPPQDSLVDRDVKANAEEASAQEQLSVDESEENETKSVESKLSNQKTEDGTAGSEEPMEEGADASGAADASGDENEETGEEKDAESEEVDNLQLAWEMLELAKVIFKRQERKEIQLCAAQAYLKLGEVGIESENYTQAVEDFHECLTIQEKHLEGHNRLLAETHYQLGLAYSLNNQYDFSLKHFKESFNVIEKRLAMLTERIEKAEEKGKSPAKDTDAVSEDKREIEELKELLPEIKAKIEDAEESKDDGSANKALQETLSRPSAFAGLEKHSLASSAPTLAVQTGKVTDEASTSSSNCVSNITHLVRKKSSLQRKPEDGERDNKDPKKAKQEESAVNGGCGDTAHDRNGVPEKMESEESVSSKKSEPEAQC